MGRRGRSDEQGKEPTIPAEPGTGEGEARGNQFPQSHPAGVRKVSLSSDDDDESTCTYGEVESRRKRARRARERRERTKSRSRHRGRSRKREKRDCDGLAAGSKRRREAREDDGRDESKVQSREDNESHAPSGHQKMEKPEHEHSKQRPNAKAGTPNEPEGECVSPKPFRRAKSSVHLQEGPGGTHKMEVAPPTLSCSLCGRGQLQGEFALAQHIWAKHPDSKEAQENSKKFAAREFRERASRSLPGGHYGEASNPRSPGDPRREKSEPPPALSSGCDPWKDKEQKETQEPQRASLLKAFLDTTNSIMTMMTSEAQAKK